MADIFPIDQARAALLLRLLQTQAALRASCFCPYAFSQWLHCAAAPASSAALRSKAALPVIDGELHVAGLSAPVIVRRDAHGRSTH